MSRVEWQDATRQKIQASAILNRVIDHILSDEDLMSASQVAAANKLLSKVLPDLKAVEHTGGDTPIEIVTKIMFKGKSSKD